jgi:hypothetical protein
MTPRDRLRAGMMMAAAALGFCALIYGYAAVYDMAYSTNAVVAFLASALLLWAVPTDGRRRNRSTRRKVGSSRRRHRMSGQE